MDVGYGYDGGEMSKQIGDKKLGVGNGIVGYGFECHDIDFTSTPFPLLCFHCPHCSTYTSTLYRPCSRSHATNTRLKTSCTRLVK